MKLVNAVKNGTAINRSGTRPIRVMSMETTSSVRYVRGFNIYEIEDESPVSGKVRMLYDNCSIEADVKDFLAQQGYKLDPDAWHEG